MKISLGSSLWGGKEALICFKGTVSECKKITCSIMQFLVIFLFAMLW